MTLQDPKSSLALLVPGASGWRVGFAPKLSGERAASDAKFILELGGILSTGWSWLAFCRLFQVNLCEPKVDNLPG